MGHAALVKFCARFLLLVWGALGCLSISQDAQIAVELTPDLEVRGYHPALPLELIARVRAFRETG